MQAEFLYLGKTIPLVFGESKHKITLGVNTSYKK